MQKILPLHSLIINLSESSSQSYISVFEKHEILTNKSVEDFIFGNNVIPTINYDLIAELRKIIYTKLSYGERVVVNIDYISEHNRKLLSKTAASIGASVFYLIDDNTDNNAKFGDGLAEPINIKKYSLSPINKLNSDICSYIKKNFQGITVVGDVHGMHQTLLNAISWAKSRNNFIVFLGDLISYGPSSIEVVNEVYKLIMRGGATICLGNHEKKILRWIDDDKKVRLSAGNIIATNEISTLDFNSKKKWIGKFKAIIGHARYVIEIDDHIFSHAAIHTSYWNESKNNQLIENFAMFGEFKKEKNDIKRINDWTNSIPNDKTVFVGHEIHSTVSPIKSINKNGGIAIYLDTGCGKGGILSTADLRFHNEKLKLENFNIH